MLKIEFAKIIEHYKIGCKYRRLDMEEKRQYQNLYVLSIALKSRPDYESEVVQVLAQLYVDKGYAILTASSHRDRKHKVAEIDKKIASQMALLP